MTLLVLLLCVCAWLWVRGGLSTGTDEVFGHFGCGGGMSARNVWKERVWWEGVINDKDVLCVIGDVVVWCCYGK